MEKEEAGNVVGLKVIEAHLYGPCKPITQRVNQHVGNLKWVPGLTGSHHVNGRLRLSGRSVGVGDMSMT